MLVQGTTNHAANLASDWAAHSLIELKSGQARLDKHIIGDHTIMQVGRFNTSTDTIWPVH